MKKLVLMFVAIAAISFASCGNNTKTAATNADSLQDTVVNDTTNATDSLPGDSL